MPIKTFQFMIVLSGTIVVFGQMCIAGTWIDDFSDRNLRDWGFRGLGGGTVMNDEVSLGVVGGHFYFRGKKQHAHYNMTNRGFELKFMVRNIRVPRESSWFIRYASFNEETGEFDGLMTFLWYPEHGEEPNVIDVTIDRFERGVLKEHPEFEGVWIAQTAAIDSFAYEEMVWYTLRIARQGNQYSFSMGDVSLFAEDDSVPMGTIELFFKGRCTIWLDDFTVTGPDVPNGGPGFLGVNPLADRVTTMWGKLKAQN